MSELIEESGPGAAPRPTGRNEVVETTVRAAAKLFAERNPSQVSVREIAARAGVSHALVHRYMGSKEEIFGAALAYSRSAAADYWMSEHGLSESAGTFAAELPPGCYVRMVVRAALDGVEISAEDMRLPHADRMLTMLETTPFATEGADRGFDVRLLFSAATAMAAGMAVAEKFFLVQSGLENEDPELISSELNRLILHILSLAQKNPAGPA